MRPSFTAALLATPLLVAAAAVPSSLPSLAPALPLTEFKNPFVTPIPPQKIKDDLNNQTEPELRFNTFAVTAAATCTNPRNRPEWESYSTADRQSFVDAIKCLMIKPASGLFAPATNRYEDFVRLHQAFTPNIHGNAKFLIYHRYFLWNFEQELRNVCGFTKELPWFDETKFAGSFSKSSIYSAQWFGSIAIGGSCVPDGQFKGITLNIGPGPTSTPHCLQRKGDASLTANCNTDVITNINNYNDYKDMAYYAEGGAHAYGHNGVGGAMADVYASPGDPTFWLHHAFIDRNFRVWQNKDSARASSIDGVDVSGAALTLETWMRSNGLAPDAQVKDFINTLGTKPCYRYSY